MSRRVLFISHDPVGRQMAGLGIRAFELGRVLREHADVTIAHGGVAAGALDGMRAVPFAPHDPSPLKREIAAADVVVCHPVWPVVGGWLRRSGARVVHDLYDPETLETLALFAGRRSAVRRLHGHTTLDRLHDALRTGHHFMCASEKQRDLWLGALLALRCIDPLGYDADPSFRSAIDVVPFGLPPGRPGAADPAAGPHAQLPGLEPDAEVVLWNGGIWRWLDAETAIRAVHALSARRPRVRLVFMGGSRQAAAREATERAQMLSHSLGALDRTVLFHDGWVPYEERASWLAAAACAVSANGEHLEARFAFRTRVLDCFWAGLPVVCTEGDALADRILRDDLGAVVPAGNPAALGAALERVLDRGRATYAAPLERAAADHPWPRVAAPLVRWVADNGPPWRPGDAPGALGPGAGQRARAAAYRAARPLVAALRRRER